MDQAALTLLEYRALGVMTIGAIAAAVVLWRTVLSLQKQKDEMIGRYEAIIKDLSKQQQRFESTLESLQEGLAAQDLVNQVLKRLDRD